MPTYVYECKQCKDSFEIEQRITEDSLTDCGKCGGTIRRIIQPVGIAFKGAGFYVNDASAKPAAKEETKTESAPVTPQTTPFETPATPATSPTPSESSAPA